MAGMTHRLEKFYDFTRKKIKIKILIIYLYRSGKLKLRVTSYTHMQS